MSNSQVPNSGDSPNDSDQRGNPQNNGPPQFAPSDRKIEQRIDAAKHLSQTHRHAHLERRKIEFQIVTSVLLIFLVCAATVALQGKDIELRQWQWTIGAVAFFSLTLACATAVYLKQIHNANNANTAFMETAENWLAVYSFDDWYGAWMKAIEEYKPHRTRNESRCNRWFISQAVALFAAAFLLIGVTGIATRPNAAPDPQKPEIVQARNVKIEIHR